MDAPKITKIRKEAVFNSTHVTSMLKIPNYQNLSQVGDEPGMRGNILTGSVVSYNGR